MDKTRYFSAENVLTHDIPVEMYMYMGSSWLENPYDVFFFFYLFRFYNIFFTTTVARRRRALWEIHTNFFLIKIQFTRISNLR